MLNLDHLIDDGRDPDYQTEYIYNFHLLFKDGAFDSEECKPGIIVNNVSSIKRNGRHCGYRFSLKDDDTNTYHCNYPWAFILNTPEEVEKLKIINDVRREIKQKETHLRNLTSKLKSLSI